ncbi:hypothetical protein [Micromonospora echinofusca]|uniref:hypothetical protein n=1 Tax=Micromonospora echinofusca TaxID=47858 RepID=UPI001FCB9B07|nr:hypothetical protein [Micromonospora echinofusca]
MTGTEHPAGVAAEGTDASDLVAELRQLAGADPAGVRQVVAEVLAALDRAAGGVLRDQLPEAIRRDVADAESAGSDRATVIAPDVSVATRE